MRQRKKVLPYLFVSVFSFAALLFFIFFIDPLKGVTIGSVSISPVIFFFVLLFTFLFSLTTFFLMQIRISILITGFLVSLLFLQLIGFFNIYYAIILLLIVGLIELGCRHK